MKHDFATAQSNGTPYFGTGLQLRLGCVSSATRNGHAVLAKPTADEPGNAPGGDRQSR